jgi:transcriptional regulator GlxA family with amidase domain
MPSEGAMLSLGFILHSDFSPMGLAALTAFELANAQSEEKLYDVSILSANGGPVKGSIGFSIDTESVSDRYFDLLIVSGSMQPPGTEVVDFLKTAPRFSRRIASICTGAFVLAAAGLLDGRRATTHWAYAQQMKENYPKIKVEEDLIFIKDGPIWTSAGMTAGIDLALALIEEDFGADLARLIAKKLVIFIAVPEDRRSILRCWSWNQSQTASRKCSLMRGAIWKAVLTLKNWPVLQI